MNDIYISRPLTQLPKESDRYYVDMIHNQYVKSVFNHETGRWGANALEATHWLEPVTLEKLLSEHPEVVEKYRREGFHADFSIEKLSKEEGDKFRREADETVEKQTAIANGNTKPNHS